MTPRGIEILVKKASVDGAFRGQLLGERSAAAERIGLTLDPAEAAMLDAIPEAQLVAIIEKTKVAPLLRPAFMGYAAAAMLAAVGGFVNVSIAESNVGEDNESTDFTDEYLDSINGLAPKVDLDANNYEEPPKIGVTGIRPDSTKILVPGEFTGSVVFVSGDGEDSINRSKPVLEEAINYQMLSIEEVYSRLWYEEGALNGGKLQINILINRDGIVGNVNLIHNGTGSDMLFEEVKKVIGSWDFPKAGGEVTVTYDCIFGQNREKYK